MNGKTSPRPFAQGNNQHNLMEFHFIMNLGSSLIRRPRLPADRVIMSTGAAIGIHETSHVNGKKLHFQSCDSCSSCAIFTTSSLQTKWLVGARLFKPFQSVLVAPLSPPTLKQGRSLHSLRMRTGLVGMGKPLQHLHTCRPSCWYQPPSLARCLSFRLSSLPVFLPRHEYL